jgi:three-Cys-motif partner protein
VTRHERHFEAFQPHTRLKHAILDSYIVAWAMKLLMWGRAGRELAIVDAFGGAGRDEEGNDGSPLIAIKRARQAMADARKRGIADAKVHVYAIEKKPGQFRALQETLAPFIAQNPDLVHVLHGELVDHIDHIRSIVGNSPTFYFLDPFGIKGLDASTYQNALAGPHNEMFALFADIGAVRLHGLVTAERADASSEIESILAMPSFFAEYDEAQIEAAQQRAAQINDALDSCIPASREHLTRALGGDQWITTLANAPPEKRADEFLRLFRDALMRAGARHVITVPMRNDEGRRVYALVHASKSRYGLVTMKECVSTGLNREELSAAARNAIRSDLSIDASRLVDALQQQFAGSSIPWAGEQHGLKALLLGHTPLFHFQAAEVKTELKSRGILKRVDRKEQCVFPVVN